MLIGHGSIQEGILESAIQSAYLTHLENIAGENRKPPVGTAMAPISWEEQGVSFIYLLNLLKL